MSVYDYGFLYNKETKKKLEGFTEVEKRKWITTKRCNSNDLEELLWEDEFVKDNNKTANVRYAIGLINLLNQNFNETYYKELIDLLPLSSEKSFQPA